MGQIIVVGNLKGGTGKTTIAVNLACAFAERGSRVALLDVDPQASASAWGRAGGLPIRIETAPPSEGVAGGRWLARAAELASSVDLLVVDLPPVIVPAIASAMMIADLVLVPVTPSALDVAPTERVLRMIRITRESRPGHKPPAMLVPNRVDFRGHYHEATEAAVESLRERWAPPIRQLTDHVNAFALGTWIGRYAPNSKAAQDIETLADEVAGTLGLARRQQAAATQPDKLADETQLSA
jgi:chromosome partitioning protein